MIFLVEGATVLILTAIAALHLYWVLGGRFGLGAAVPSNDQGAPLFKPGKFATLLVSLGLAAMALTVCDHAHWIPAPWARNVFRACAVVFFLRAVGDGNHVGFFSKKRTSRFHHWDLRLHSPLSLTLSVLFAVLAFVR